MVRFRVPSAVLLISLAATAAALAQGFSPLKPGQAQPAPDAQPHDSPFGAETAQPPMAPPQSSASPGFGAQPENQATQPPRTNFADELTDFGVPPQATLRSAVAGETPLTIPGGHVITTTEMRQAVGSDILLVDVWNTDAHPSLPGAVLMPGAGDPGSFNDDTGQRLWAALSSLTHRQPQHPIIFFCTGSRCWESYNAALRAINMGFKMVLWYRGGLGAWRAAGLTMVTPGQGQAAAAPQQRGPGFDQ